MMGEFFIAAETLVQSLKQNHLTFDQKIELAQNVLNHHPGSTTLPNPEEFLLEWCIQQLVRSTKLTEDKSAGAPYLNPDYYKLLLRLIPLNQTSHFVKATLSRSPLIPVITRMLDYIKMDLEKGATRSVELGSTLVGLAAQILREGASLMESVNQDWVVNLLLSTISLLQLDHKGMRSSVIDLLKIPLLDLTEMFRWSAIYKKVFSTMIDQLMLPLSRCRYLLGRFSFEESQAKEVANMFDDLISIGLFHPTFVADYANLVSNPTASFYRKQLFKFLRKHMIEYPESILDLMPLIFQQFLTQYSTTGAPKIDFEFGWELISIMSDYLALEPEWETQASVIKKVTEILEAFQLHAVYVPSNDTASQAQLVKLGEVYRIFKRFWGDKILSSHLLYGYCALVSIDYCLVDEDVYWLWKLISAPEADDLDSASRLGLALLQEYGKARQLDRCFQAMLAAFNEVLEFTRFLLCHESFALGFHATLDQLGSAVQASRLLETVCSSVRSQSELGSILILTHLVNGFSSNLLPSCPGELETVVDELGEAVFVTSSVADLVSELNSLTQEIIKQSPLKLDTPKFKAVASLHLFANLQDRWPKAFLSEAALSQVVARCRSNLTFSSCLVASWEIFLVRLLLQHLERSTMNLTYHSSCFNFIISLLQHSAPPVNDGIMYILLGPYLPIVGELMPLDQKKILIHLLVTDLLSPRCSTTSVFTKILSNARFYEVANLRTLFLNDLFDRLSLCFSDSPLDPSLAESSLLLYRSGDLVDYLKLNQLQQVLLVLTHLPSCYLSASHRPTLLSLLFTHQKLLSLLQESSSSIQVGWEISLGLVCSLLTSDLTLVKQHPNYLSWLFDSVTGLLAKISTNANLLTDQLVHILGTGMFLALTHQAGMSSDLAQLFELPVLSLDGPLKLTIKHEILCQVVRQVRLNAKICEKLRQQTISLFQPAYLSQQWFALDKMVTHSSLHDSRDGLRTALALMSLYFAASSVPANFVWPENLRGTLSRLLTLCHQYLKTAPASESSLLEGGIELHCAIIKSYPIDGIPDDNVLPLLASFLSLCKRVVILTADTSFADLSTEMLRRNVSEFLRRISQSQWDAVVGAIFEHLLGIPSDDDIRTLFFVLTLFLGDSSDSFRKILIPSLSQIIQNLVQPLIINLGERKYALTMIAAIVQKPEYQISPGVLGALLSCLENLAVGDAESERTLGRILNQIMKGHTKSISNHMPSLVSSLVRASQYQMVDMGFVLQSLPTSKEVPGIQHHIQYLLFRLVNMHQPSSNDTSAFTGWFHCFNALHPISPESILMWLDPTRQYLLKRAYQEYNAHHKFSGKV